MTRSIFNYPVILLKRLDLRNENYAIVQIIIIFCISRNIISFNLNCKQLIVNLLLFFLFFLYQVEWVRVTHSKQNLLFLLLPRVH